MALSSPSDFLRPQVETVHTLQDHTPSRLFSDLLRKKDALLPLHVERARKTLERPMPQRKATRPVDQRISRSKLSVSGEDGRDLLRGQVPRTPSRLSVPSIHGQEASSTDSHEEDIQTPRATVSQQASRQTAFEDNGVQSASLASPLAVVPEATAVRSDVIKPEATPSDVSPTDQSTPALAEVQATSGQENTEATTLANDKDASADASDVVLSLDGDRSGFAGSGARLSRKRPVSKDLDQPVQEGDSNLRRTGSSETSKVRGPRRKFRCSVRDGCLIAEENGPISRNAGATTSPE